MSGINHSARQLQIPAEEFSKYANRNNTLWEHHDTFKFSKNHFPTH